MLVTGNAAEQGTSYNICNGGENNPHDIPIYEAKQWLQQTIKGGCNGQWAPKTVPPWKMRGPFEVKKTPWCEKLWRREGIRLQRSGAVWRRQEPFGDFRDHLETSGIIRRL